MMRCGWTVEYVGGLSISVAMKALECVDKVRVEEVREELMVSAFGMADKKGRRDIDRTFSDPWKARRKARVLKGKKKQRADEVEAAVRKKYSGV